jgi:hypothetical protein
MIFMSMLPHYKNPMARKTISENIGQTGVGQACLRRYFRQAEIGVEKGLEVTGLVSLHGDLRCSVIRIGSHSLNRATVFCDEPSVNIMTNSYGQDFIPAYFSLFTGVSAKIKRV